MKRKSQLFSLLLLYVILVFVQGANAQSITIRAKKLELKVGETKSITITSESDLGQISWSGDTAFFSKIDEIQIQPRSVTLALTAKAPGSGRLSLSAALLGSSDFVEFSISPTLDLSGLIFEPALDEMSDKTFLQDEEILIRVRRINQAKIDDGLIEAVVEPKEAGRAFFQNGMLSITGKLPQDGATVRLISEGRELTNFEINIEEAVGQIIIPPDSTITLKQGGSAATLSNRICAALRLSIMIVRWRVTPGAWPGTRNSVIPSRSSRSPEVRVATTRKSATWPSRTKTFCPFRP